MSRSSSSALVEAFYAATKTIITVGPNHLVDEGPTWFEAFSAVMMMAALAFTALVTAGLVNRLVDRRLCGRRCLPRADHVVVVGLGQVGLRLCLLLRELDVPVVAIESNPDADYCRAREESRHPDRDRQRQQRLLCCAAYRCSVRGRWPP